MKKVFSGYDCHFSLALKKLKRLDFGIPNPVFVKLKLSVTALYNLTVRAFSWNNNKNIFLVKSIIKLTKLDLPMNHPHTDYLARVFHSIHSVRTIVVKI